MKNILKKRIKFIVIVIGVFLAINVALSFAYIRGGSVDSESVSTIALTGGQILVKYSSKTGAIAVSDINPGYEGNKQFTITSDFGENHGYYVDGIWYTVALIVEENEFDTNSIQYSLSLDSTSEDDGITLASIQNEGIATGTNTSRIILGSGRFNSHNKKHVYNLKISYPDNGTDQSHEIGCKFKAYIDFINTNMVGLTFNLDGGSFTNLNLNDNTTIKVPANSAINLPIPNKDRYIFAGWEKVSGNVSTNSNVISTGNSDISIKALWMTSAPFEFAYTGGEQEFIAQYSGYYKLETWGGQGGSANSTYIGGYGAYSKGIVQINKDSIIYINIGGKGNTTSTAVSQTAIGGYNGGGNGKNYTSSGRIFGSGGGATHISKTSGLLASLSPYEVECQTLSTTCPIIIVSGGGGGAAYYNGSYFGQGGHAGGYIGSEPSASSHTKATGGTQTSGGGFGQGGSASEVLRAGGGGGFYGGNSQYYNAAGGSGYIGYPLLSDKYMYCYNCATSNVESTKTYTTTCASETPTENCAKKGNGFARITYLHN